MSNYQQTAVTGESWIRSNRIVLENPLGGVPSVTFQEERVVNAAGLDPVLKPLGSLVEPFTDENAAEPFTLLHPLTGAAIGSATYTDVYVMIHSLYYHIAQKRDAG